MFGAQQTPEKPIQLYHIDNSGVQCHLLEPADTLKHGIFYYWHITIAPGTVELSVIPDNAVDLVMSPNVSDFSTVYLPVTETFSIKLEGPVHYVGVCFQLDQWSRFFQTPLPELREIADGESTTQRLGIADLVSALQGVDDLAQIKSILDAEFGDRVDAFRSVDEPIESLRVDHLIEAMQQTVGTAGVAEVAARFDLSDRQFRRILTNMFGYGPKKIQRVVRLQLALKDLVSPESGATLDGFFDDAHRVKELRSLTGMTPGDIRRMAEIYNQLK